MHVHTIFSAGSLLAPEDLIEQAIELGLDGVCVMEHDSMLASETTEEFAEGSSVTVFRGVEASTDLGHILVYGVTVEQWRPYEKQKGIQAQKLLDMVQEWEAVAVPAHPFRFNSPAVGAKLETLVGIFAIEGLNGRCDSEENQLACQAAERLNLKITGGSDATTPGLLGSCLTEFDRQINTMAELVEEMKKGRFRARYF